MITLYSLPGSCSLAVHVALHEVGATFEVKSISVPDGQPRTAEFLAINPRGNAPVLVSDGFMQREAGAILITLLDENKNALLPASGHARATKIISTNVDQLHKLAGALLELETLTGDEIKAIIGGGTIDRSADIPAVLPTAGSSIPRSKRPKPGIGGPASAGA